MELSEEELEVLKDVEFILTKRRVSEKIEKKLAGLAVMMEALFERYRTNVDVSPFLSTSPKVSKGENYQQLPYFILDYPRHFTAENTFAIRTMLLWGSFYSMTLHVSGILQKKISGRLLENRSEYNDYYYCVNSTPWEHTYEPNNYLLINDLDDKYFTETIEKHPFLKISKPFELTELEKLPEHMTDFLYKIFPLLD